MDNNVKYIESSSVVTSVNSVSVEQGNPDDDGRGINIQRSKYFGKEIYRIYGTMGDGGYDFQMELRGKDLDLFIKRLKDMMKDD